VDVFSQFADIIPADLRNSQLSRQQNLGNNFRNGANSTQGVNVKK
jgi:hypothetical protein